MSFSFEAAGSKAETLGSLLKLADTSTGMSEDGREVLKLITKVMEEASEGGGSTPMRFSVTAAGHTGPGLVPFLNIILTSEYQPT